MDGAQDSSGWLMAGVDEASTGLPAKGRDGAAVSICAAVQWLTVVATNGMLCSLVAVPGTAGCDAEIPKDLGNISELILSARCGIGCDDVCSLNGARETADRGSSAGRRS